MFTRAIHTAVVTAVVLMAVACTGTPYLHSQWGKSVKTAKQEQIVNPQAGLQSAAAQEISGTASGHAVDSYQKSFKALETK